MDRLGSLPMGIPGGVENRLVVQKSGWKARIMTFQGNAVVEAGKNNFLESAPFFEPARKPFPSGPDKEFERFFISILMSFISLTISRASS